jgi:hypothetical protein
LGDTISDPRHAILFLADMVNTQTKPEWSVFTLPGGETPGKLASNVQNFQKKILKEPNQPISDQISPRSMVQSNCN